jgi:putative chitinase
VTPEQLYKCIPYSYRADREKFYQPIVDTMAEFCIDTPLRQAFFLAQIAHESGSLRYVEEIASGAAYEGRADLGNVEPGDGIFFKGRGLIQITGRANYQRCGEALGLDLIGCPEILELPQNAARSAGWFWAVHNLNASADANDIRTNTRIINGGYTGLLDRTQRLIEAKRGLGIV